jgi:hypothetical protein
VKKAYLYRLYPRQTQAALLQQQFDVAREVYHLSLPRDQVSAMIVKRLGRRLQANAA